MLAEPIGGKYARGDVGPVLLLQVTALAWRKAVLKGAVLVAKLHRRLNARAGKPRSL